MNTRFIFFDFFESTHSKRFISTANSLGFNISFQQYANTQVDNNSILLLSTIDKIPDAFLHYSNLKVGISWAYDIYRERDNETVKNTRVKNLGHLDKVLVDCESISAGVQGYGVPKTKISVFPYGVVLDNYKIPTKVKRNIENSLTLYSNRAWEKGYGVEYLLTAAQLIAQEGTQMNLILANDGSQRKEILRRFSIKNHLFNLKYVGNLSEKENKKFLEGSHFYVSASESDGISVSILESMAVGTPVIVSNLSSNRELIQNNRNGILFQSGDASNLAQTIKESIKIYQNTENFKELISCARKTVEAKADFVQNLSGFLRSLSESSVK